MIPASGNERIPPDSDGKITGSCRKTPVNNFKKLRSEYFFHAPVISDVFLHEPARTS
jgi:hypothetical protein